MKKFAAMVAMVCLALGACKKKEKAAAEEATVSAPAEAVDKAAEEAQEKEAKEAKEEQAKEDAERAAQEKSDKAEKLAYAQMEDGYLNDPKGQWASAAKASSSFGSADQAPPESQDSNTPFQATGAPNGNTWSNNNQEMGIDWLELTFAKPVNATELRVVQVGGNIGSVSKIELIDESGAKHEIWSGADETVKDKRGQRTWLVKTFEKTSYKVTGAKISFANAVVSGYKEVDAVQLIGE